MAVFWIAAAVPAMAQTPAPRDSVTVTAGKIPKEVIDSFIASHAAPTQALDQMARWNVPVCPMVAGVPKEFARFVERRIREVAAEVGAPVREGCKQNVSIIFTPEPQSIVNEIRRRSSAFLGYHHSTAQGDELAKVTHPVQAWHMTGTRDLRGNLEADNPRGQTNTLVIRYPDPLVPQRMLEIYLPNASARTVTGGRLGNGLSSEFTHALIVADIKWAQGPEIGAVADAMAVLALSRPALQDNCSSMASILDSLAKDCPRGAETTAITAADLAFLSGLYRMKPDDFLTKQQNEVAYQMQQALGGQ
ncbi:MAG: hypothetical protein V4601_13995 [Pseudomonadota bacterium]